MSHLKTLVRDITRSIMNIRKVRAYFIPTLLEDGLLTAFGSCQSCMEIAGQESIQYLLLPNGFRFLSIIDWIYEGVLQVW